MEDKFNEAVELFVAQRVEDIGTKGSTELDATISAVSESIEKLDEILDGEQRKMLNVVENAISMMSGEETRHYYKTGFHDAIRFLFSWGDRL